MLVGLKEVLAIGKEKNIAVGNFNTPNLECLLALVRECEFSMYCLSLADSAERECAFFEHRTWTVGLPVISDVAEIVFGESPYAYLILSVASFVSLSVYKRHCPIEVLSP